MAGDGVTYSPEDVTVVFGPWQIRGFAKGTFVEAKRTEEAWKMKHGLTRSTRVLNPNKSGSVKVVLQADSPSNADLANALILDEKNKNGIFPVMVKDLRGNEVASGAKAWVRAYPAMGFNDEGPTREWEIDVQCLELFPGGHDL
jgi:hypothetical protein